MELVYPLIPTAHTGTGRIILRKTYFLNSQNTFDRNMLSVMLYTNHQDHSIAWQHCKVMDNEINHSKYAWTAESVGLWASLSATHRLNYFTQSTKHAITTNHGEIKFLKPPSYGGTTGGAIIAKFCPPWRVLWLNMVKHRGGLWIMNTSA